MLHKINSEDLNNKEFLSYKVSLYIMSKGD